MGTKKFKNELEDLAETIQREEKQVKSERYQTVEKFVQAYKEGEIEDQDLTVIFHKNTPGHVTVLGDNVGISYGAIERLGGIDKFISALLETKRDKKRKAMGD